MGADKIVASSASVYRVDKFAVPMAARSEFLANVTRIHAILRTLPGLVRDEILEQSSGNSEFNFVTVVEWESQAALDRARPVVMEKNAQHNFNPHELFSRLGIRADLANYQRLDA